MKVAFVLDDTLDTPDGVQQYVLTLGSWLSAAGHEVHYLVGQTARTDIPHIHSLGNNIKVRFNGNRMSMPLPASKSTIGRLMRQEQFDIVHVQMPYSPLLAGRIIAAAPSSTVIVGTFHIAPNSLLVATANRALGIWLRPQLHRFAAIVSVSQAAATFARQAYGIHSTILPNVVETSQFERAEPFPELQHVPLVVFLGRLVPRKGCRVLLEAVRLLRREAKEVPFKVVVCGRGPLEYELKRFVEKHKLADRVSFAGFVSDADKARYLKSASLAVFPSLGGESFGIVLIEAMAAGSPVVLAANNPGYASVMAPCPELLVPVDDAPALAGSMKQYLLSASDRRKALGWQSDYVRQFDVSAVGSSLLAIYNSALQGNRSVR